jgi:SNF2 family DNA or RNA helicase
MVFLSLSANPVNLVQAIGRIHRPGQKRGVNVTFLQCRETIDQRAYELIRNHQELSEAQINELLGEES